MIPPCLLLTMFPQCLCLVCDTGTGVVTHNLLFIGRTERALDLFQPSRYNQFL